MPTLAELREEYQRLWDTIQIRPERLASIRLRVADMIQPHRRIRYETVQARTEVPWLIVACIHSLESDINFRGHLHNGDSLNARTVRVPRGHPRTGSPPFSWEESAVDALEMKRTPEVSEWSIPECLFYLERYNGWGYRSGAGSGTTPRSRSPYLWSFTTHYTRGKFVADHVFDANAVSQQMGAAALLRELIDTVRLLPSEVVGVRNPTQFDRPMLRRGSRGEFVAEAQILLRDAGFSPGPVDGIFGSKTENAVLDFQRDRRIEVDGVVGPETWDALIAGERPVQPVTPPPPPPTDLRRAVLDFAIQEASKGRRHAPGNEIDRLVLDPLRPILKELRHLGPYDDDVFYNWCAAWVTFICREQGIRIPDRHNNFWASVAKVEAWRAMAMNLGAWFRVGTRSPQPGDIVVYNWDDDLDTDHIGILRELRAAQRRLIVCEGNFSNVNREFIADRSLNDVEGYIDLEQLARALA